MGYSEIFLSSLEKFINNELAVLNEEDLRENYSPLVKKFAGFELSAVFNTEEMAEEKYYLIGKSSELLGKSGYSGIALALLFQNVLGGYLFSILKEKTAFFAEIYASFLQGENIFTLPADFVDIYDSKYWFYFDTPAEKLIILNKEQANIEVLVNIDPFTEKNDRKRFAWDGFKELILTEEQKSKANLLKIGYLSENDLENLEKLKNYLITGVIVGLLAKVFNTGLEYAKTRIQFEKPIIHFQVISHYLAKMYSQYLVAKTAWEEVVTEIREETFFELNFATFITGVLDELHEASDFAVQIFGGNGYMMEYPVQRFWRESMLLKKYLMAEEG